LAAISPQGVVLRKLLLAAAATLLAVGIGWPSVHFFRKLTKKPRQGPYGLQLVDDGGRALGKAHGPLKIVFDPFTVYRLAPNQKTRRITINEHGGRGAIADSDAPVVAFLGGSACFGQELANDEEVFTAILSRTSSSRRWMNFGCPGYYSGQESSFYLHRLRTLAPSVVVSVGGWNDVFDAVQGAPRRLGWEGFNATFFEIRDRLSEFHAGGDGCSVPPPETNRDEAFERNCRTYIDNMIDLDRLAKGRGAKFLWVIQPELGGKADRSQYENDILSVWERHYGYSPAEFSRRFAELRRRAKVAAAEHGVALLDVNESELWRSQSVVLFADPVHPNADGHRVLAEVLASAVERAVSRNKSAAAN
jgi:lysophospholipase L1-like esterase